MKLSKTCRDYFNSFKAVKKNDGHRAVNIVKIISMFTVIAPLAMGGLWLIDKALDRRAKKEKPSNSVTVEKVASQRFSKRMSNPSTVNPKSRTGSLDVSGKNSTSDFDFLDFSGSEASKETDVNNPIMMTPPLSQEEIDHSAGAPISLQTTDPQPIIFTPDRLKEEIETQAITNGFGYKAANLMVLEKQAKAMSEALEDAIVSVPPFVPISDGEIREFLGDRAEEIDQLWSKASKFLVRGSESIPPDALKLLTQIQKILQECFSQKKFSNDRLESWLNNAPPQSLIVRSTGMEDSDTQSNAGGNESIAYVKRENLSETIGKVLSSYFSEKSIAQRLQAKDETLFSDARPFLPVLVQEMVLEEDNPTDETILRSGVLFTYQQEQSKGVTLIQTGLGNNEGIVTSQVGVDSYYVDDQGKIHAVLRNKRTRFVHGAPVENRMSVARQAALTNQQIKNLKKVASHLNQCYGKALDVEYSVSSGKIYLFQARPLIAPKKKEPSYLNLTLLKTLSKNHLLLTPVLIDTAQQVRMIKSDSEVLFMDDLQQAYKEYLRNPGEVHTIFIKKSAPSTSHEAVKLREMGLTVVVLTEEQEYEKAEQMVAAASETNQVWLDPQHGLMVETKAVANSAELLASGRIRYPISREITIPQGIFDLKQLQNSEKAYDKIMHALVPDGNYLKMDGSDPVSLHRMLDLIASEDTTESKRALGSLLRYLHNTLGNKLKNTAPHQKQHLDVLVNLFQYALKIAQEEVLPAIEQHSPSSMERLYPLKFLESIIYQQPSLDVIGGNSFAIWLNWDRKERAVVDEAKHLGIDIKDPNAVRLFSLGRDASYSKETLELWGKAISKDSPIEKLLPLVEKLHQVHLLEGFINITFRQDPNINLLQAMETVLNESEGLRKAKVSLLSEDEIKKYGSPNYAERNIDAFKKSSMEQFTTLQEMYENASPVVKQAILQNMHQLINQYDLVIKQVTGSTQFPENLVLKTKLFAELLEGYFQLMEGCVKLLSPDDEAGIFQNKALVSLNLKPIRTMPEYLEGLKNGHRYNTQTNVFFGVKFETSIGFNKLLKNINNNEIKNLEALYLTKPGFSVSTMTIGSRLDMSYGLRWPNTLEEYFTVFHQNMEFILSFEKRKNGLTEKTLDQALQPTILAMKEVLEAEPSTIFRNGREITLGFNIPLRCHAASIQISYNTDSPEKKRKVKLTLLGGNDGKRWYNSATFLELLQHSSKYKLEKPGKTSIQFYNSPDDVTEFSFEVMLKDGEETKNWMEIFKELFDATSDFNFPNFNELVERYGLECETLPTSLFSYCLFYREPILKWQNVLHPDLDANLRAEFVMQYLKGLVKFRITRYTFDADMLPKELITFMKEASKEQKDKFIAEFVIHPVRRAHLEEAFPQGYEEMVRALK